MNLVRLILAVITMGVWVLSSLPTGAQDNSIFVQSTTSTKNSGLYKHLLPKFKQASGITVHVVAVGTGQAIRNAMKCDGDVLLVHAKSAEEKFVADGFGFQRYDLMYNDFIIVGPVADPAGAGGSTEVKTALKRIAKARSLFASRGDDSGTHKKEMSLWKKAGIDPVPSSGKWYRSTGSGMGVTLNTGIGMGAYVLTDRATWISFKNKGDYKIQVEGDAALFNQYGVILVNKEKCASVKADLGQQFIDWLRSPEGQSSIAGHQIAGQQLFFPNAK